ncbi:acyltransferase [Geomesophilobacter sediminis]|uniref:Acyltransferase n=1 Tax=Geomesophilobacter sediminis TaxID=2798584 RepID=A0A8J7LXT8_9BACT|nr:acyltransferase [Geomesophilobacter sediminis]MBJ6723676.1 acyltransferase [Geomesophilobacter sediminis]
MSFTDLATKIRRRETPFYDFLYRCGKRVNSLNMPAFKPLYRFLYAERATRRSLWHWCKQFFYYTPMFKSRCVQVGKNLRLMLGIPAIQGNLRFIIGDNVTIHGVATFSGAKVFDEPKLIVGDNTHLGYQLSISVGRDVTIGKNVLIANRVTILSYDGHPSDPAKRHLPAPPESSRPITIGDNVWIGANSVILKGVIIGDGSIVATGSVVTSKVPPNSIAVGNPARVFPLMLDHSA